MRRQSALGGSVLLASPFSHKKVEASSKACVSHYHRRFFAAAALKNLHAHLIFVYEKLDAPAPGKSLLRCWLSGSDFVALCDEAHRSAV